MAKKHSVYQIVRKMYLSARKVLLTPLFYYIGNLFSHGATHFIFLIITFVVTIYVWQKNNNEDIKPHNISLDVFWANNYDALTKKGGVTIKDSIKNLKIHFELNSKKTEASTNGNYKNRLVIEVDGEGVLKRNKFKSIESFLVTHNANQGEEDSIVIKLFSDPVLDDISFKIVPDDFIKDDTIPEAYIEFEDSDRFSFVETWRPGILLFETDTTKYYSYSENNDSVFVLKIIPAKYNKSGQISFPNGEFRSPCQTISIYSDKLGVHDNEPYYYYYINLPSVNIAGSLSLDFKVSDLTTYDSNFQYAKDKYLQYNYVFPVPDVINNGYIEYHTKDKMEQIIQNHGVIIQAVDINALNDSNNKAFLYSVLVGTGLAFLIDIIIQVIREIRNLNRRNRKKDSPEVNPKLQ